MVGFVTAQFSACRKVDGNGNPLKLLYQNSCCYDRILFGFQMLIFSDLVDCFVKLKLTHFIFTNFLMIREFILLFIEEGQCIFIFGYFSFYLDFL
jgi:hypothetical protein